MMSSMLHHPSVRDPIVNYNTAPAENADLPNVNLDLIP